MSKTTRKRWTPQEDARLLECIHLGIETAARRLDRTEAATYRRHWALKKEDAEDTVLKPTPKSTHPVLDAVKESIEYKIADAKMEAVKVQMKVDALEELLEDLSR